MTYTNIEESAKIIVVQGKGSACRDGMKMKR
jgi:hypothetical protein